MADRDDTPAAAPSENAAPRASGGAPSLARKGFSLRATPPYLIVTGSFVAAVLAGAGVAAIDYASHMRFGTRQAPARQAVVPASPSAAASQPPAKRAVVPASPGAAAGRPPAAARPAPKAPAVARPASKAPAVAAAAAPRPPAAETPKSKARPARPYKKPKETLPPKSVVAQAELQPEGSAPAKSPSLDERYKKAVMKECRDGMLGLPCREMLRWRFCGGRWNEGGVPGETSCYVQKDGSAFPPVVAASPQQCPIRMMMR